MLFILFHLIEGMALIFTEMNFLQPIIPNQRNLPLPQNQLRRLRRPAQGRAESPVKTDLLQCLPRLYGQPPAIVIQRHVALPLQPSLLVPSRLAMSKKIYLHPYALPMFSSIYSAIDIQLLPILAFLRGKSNDPPCKGSRKAWLSGIPSPLHTIG